MSRLKKTKTESELRSCWRKWNFGVGVNRWVVGLGQISANWVWCKSQIKSNAQILQRIPLIFNSAFVYLAGSSRILAGTATAPNYSSSPNQQSYRVSTKTSATLLVCDEFLIINLQGLNWTLSGFLCRLVTVWGRAMKFGRFLWTLKVQTLRLCCCTAWAAD